MRTDLPDRGFAQASVAYAAGQGKYPDIEVPFDYDIRIQEEPLFFIKKRKSGS